MTTTPRDLPNPEQPPLRIGGYRQMTADTLIEFLQQYPANTPIFTAHDRELFEHSITELKLDDWDHTTRDDDGFEITGITIGLHLGPRL